jgi:diaminopimelate decarboxylase
MAPAPADPFVPVFVRDNGRLCCESVDLGVIADAVGTPVYVYSRRAIVERYRALRDAFAAVDPLICYSVKSNSTLAVLDLLRREGSGFDVVSDGELFRALRAGADPNTIVFAGVGKTDEELRAAIAAGVRYLNIESEEELRVADGIARELGRTIDALVRVNPDVDAHTHKHITTGKRENKFGVDLAAARRMCASGAKTPHVRLRGLHCHIGSQITSVEPYLAALGRIAELVAELRGAGATIDALDFGGGFGIEYQGRGLDVAALGRALVPKLLALECRIVLEPGRSIVGAAGALLTRVIYKKRGEERTFVIVDAGMTDLMRPALYDAWHGVEPVALAGFRSALEIVDIVGPICESTDVLARERALPPLARGDLLAILQAGAYGFVMASNYNTRPRPAEVLCDGERWTVIRDRERLDDLLRGERILVE